MKQPDLGKQITELRISKGLTQQELANKCKINIRTIQRIEAGDVMPRKYTLNILSDALQKDVSSVINKDNSEALSNIPLKIAVIGGLVFVLNGLFVVYDLITKSLNPAMHLLTTIIHMVSCVIFLHGFYQVGRYYKNRLLAVGAVLMMFFLPFINLLDLLKNPIATLGELLGFIFMSLSMALMGVGLLKEGVGYKSNQYSKAYKIAGINTIIIAVTYLSLTVYIIYAGLILSIPANMLLVYILYCENNEGKPGLAAVNKLVIS